MTTPSSPLHGLLETPVLTDDDMHARIVTIVGPAMFPQLWLLFFTPLGYQLPLVVPLADPEEGLPESEQCEVMLSALAGAAREMADHPCGVLVIERPDQTTIRTRDQKWARRLHVASNTVGLPLRGAYISLASGVRPLPLTPG